MVSDGVQVTQEFSAPALHPAWALSADQPGQFAFAGDQGRVDVQIFGY